MRLPHTFFRIPAKKRNQFETWVDKIKWVVWNCPPEPWPHYPGPRGFSWNLSFFAKERASSEAATTSREAKKNFKPLGPGQPRSQILSPVIHFPYFCSKEDFINDTNMVAKSELLGVVPARPNFLERMVKSIACDNRTLLASDVLSICVTHRTYYYTDCLAHLWHIKHCLMGYQNCAKCQVCTG